MAVLSLWTILVLLPVVLLQAAEARKIPVTSCTPFTTVSVTRTEVETPKPKRSTVKVTRTYYTVVRRYRASHTDTVVVDGVETASITCWPSSSAMKDKRHIKKVSSTTASLPTQSLSMVLQTASPPFLNSSQATQATLQTITRQTLSFSPMVSLQRTTITPTVAKGNEHRTSTIIVKPTRERHDSSPTVPPLVHSTKEPNYAPKAYLSGDPPPFDGLLSKRLTTSHEQAPPVPNHTTHEPTKVDNHIRVKTHAGQSASTARSRHITDLHPPVNRIHQQTYSSGATKTKTSRSHLRGMTTKATISPKTTTAPVRYKPKPSSLNGHVRGRPKSKSLTSTNPSPSCGPTTIFVATITSTAPTPTVIVTATYTKIRTSTTRIKKPSSTTTVTRTRVTATVSTTVLGGQSARYTDAVDGKAAFKVYGKVAFPDSDLASCTCESGAICNVGQGRNGSCSGIESCMDLCARWNMDPSGPLCVGVSYFREGPRVGDRRPSVCHLKWIVPPHAVPPEEPACGVLEEDADSAVLVRQSF